MDVRDHSSSRSRDRRLSEQVPIQPDGTSHSGTAGDTLLERNIVFDRLVSGQETETGEVPPSYGEAVAVPVAVEGRSRSRGGRPRIDDGERGSREGRSRSRVGQLRESMA
jgi:hypothetical protein